ncbi:cation diffusion facilitator family transporter [Sphingomonas sp. CGMCC 1.13654]|uniref:Cation diffusion facilitator family transporter n=1 Tax=Sphingomonas chungangi TaxID=2683589 RepID=A0A838L2B7_9SPHN|nr:cation diffusion facilitator family transporter [Sphingomonas chungangi]MVW56417.1 cation diffusion facilitator family transporter [Sphingomonas chungangi]
MTENAGALNRRAALASVSLATLLLGLKGYAAVKTGSVAMLASLADTGLDLVASLVTLYGVHVAAQRADEHHRFGHGKAEALAALFQVALIAASAVAIAARAVMALAEGAPTASPEAGIVVSIIAAAATMVLLAYQKAVLARTKSIAIGADNLHYKSDLALNFAVVIALALDRYAGFHGADALFGLGIAAWLGWGAWSSAAHALDQLMDREWPEEKRRAFLDVAATIPAMSGMHDLRTRTSGAHDFAQFHMSFPPETTIGTAHDVMEAIETKLMTAFPGLEVIIHPDPVGHVDAEGTLPAHIAERSEI